MGHGFALYDVFGQTPHIQETSYQKCLLSCPGVAGCRKFSSPEFFTSALRHKSLMKNDGKVYLQSKKNLATKKTQSWIDCENVLKEERRISGVAGKRARRTAKYVQERAMKQTWNRSGKRKLQSSCEKCNEKGKYWKGLLNERWEETKETLGLKGK